MCSQNWFGFDGRDNAQSDAVFWSPADWAWTGGLMDALLPTLYFGRPIVAFNGRFSPQTALELMAQCGVTHTFLFPTALKAMMKAYPGTPRATVRQQFELKLQAIMSAGEAVGDAVFDYCQDATGRHRQRDVWPDRGQLHRGQLRRACGRPSPAAWAWATPVTGWR